MEVERDTVNQIQPRLSLALSMPGGTKEEDEAGQRQRNEHYAYRHAGGVEPRRKQHEVIHKLPAGEVKVDDIKQAAKVVGICKARVGEEQKACSAGYNAEQRHIQQHDCADLGPGAVRELHALFRHGFGIGLGVEPGLGPGLNGVHFIWIHFLPSIL